MFGNFTSFGKLVFPYEPLLILDLHPLLVVILQSVPCSQNTSIAPSLHLPVLLRLRLPLPHSSLVSYIHR
jgi:hypothetical protein